MDNRRNSSARADRNRFKFGICSNRDMNGEGRKCPKCESGEIFKIRATEDFVCPECGEPLKEVPGPKTGGKKLYIIIAAVLIVLAGVVYFLYSGNSENNVTDNEPEEQITDSTQVVPVNSASDRKVKADDSVRPESKTASSVLDWGSYEGNVNEYGEAHGTMGTVTVTKTHTFDLKTSDNEKLTVNKGDRIVDCKFNNGKFVSGEIIYSNGERRTVYIGL